MLVSRKHQKLVIKAKYPGRITAVIPTARQFTYKGTELVAVPHRLEEVRVLRNLGIAAPSPIKYYYSWPGQFTPFHAQYETAEFLTLNPKAFVLNDMGTGKTMAALWAFDYLRSLGLAKRLLIVAPLSTLERTWADEIFNNFPHLTAAVLHGTKDRRLKLLAEDFDVYIINHDGVGTIREALAKRVEVDTIVVDEVASFRNASTHRFKNLHYVAVSRQWLWGMTGTPTPNAPTDAWAQIKLISPGRVPKYFGAFRDQVMRQMGQYKWLPRETATAIVNDAMQPAIRFTRDQCVDLPPCIYQDRKVAFTPEQTTAYKSMHNQLLLEGRDYGTEVRAINEASKRTKLLQICCGIVYGSKGEEVVIPTKPRIDALKEIIEQAGGKIIVFVPFKSALRYVAETLAADGYSLGVISGDVSARERAEIFGAFQKETYPQLLIAQPASMSHGLTLTAANTIVWYAPCDSLETYLQANARVTRPGQKLTQFIVHLDGCPLERKIYDRLKHKESMQGVLLEAVEDREW